MKRAARPFVVEVRRGQKKSPFLDLDSIPDASRDDALRRAEAALFDGRTPESAPARNESNEPARRILQNLAEVNPLEVRLADELPAPRRGRKPGSKNKPKDAGDQSAQAEGHAARRVALTPDVVNAALESMAKVSAPATIERPVAEIAYSPRHVAMPNGAAKQEAKQDVSVVQSQVPSTVPAPPSQTLGREFRARSKILAMYVFKTEPKAWEIWKRGPRGKFR
jgi:hypothetical protein